MDKNIQLYCNTDATGKITKILTGERIIPTMTFQYFFMIDKKTEINLDKFYIENSQLKQMEGTTLIEVENLNPTTEQQLADMKKQMEEMQRLLNLLSTPDSTDSSPPEGTTEDPLPNSETETTIDSSEDIPKEGQPALEDSTPIEN
ncbi:hypothetical protein [Priestia aryabhattai]|uniref:hypothetical protein n=1 Tax=Priestia aryabhattai TaxID=412384 RepID=UPI0023B16271|nr:hypothetical protein [Priestia aryabhattai]MDE8676448.1 hypothetical protein [Priestia aryabhattai]